MIESVPAIWALSGLALSVLIICFYICIVFMMLFAALWGAVKFWRVVMGFFRGNYKGL